MANEHSGDGLVFRAKTFYEKYFGEIAHNGIYKVMADFVRQELATNWVSVNERLPVEFAEVWATFKDPAFTEPYVHLATYEYGEWKELVRQMGYIPLAHGRSIVAWKYKEPRPKPYQKQENDAKESA